MIVVTDINDTIACALDATRQALVMITGLVISPENFRGKIDLREKRKFPHPEIPSLNRAINEKEWKQAKDLIYGSEFYSLTTPMPGAVTALQRLTELGIEVHVVSTCGGLTRNMALHWLGLYRIPYVSVHTGVRNKAPVFKALKARVVIDNDPKHLRGLPAGMKPILLSAESCIVPPGVVVANDWNAAYEHTMQE